MKNSRVIYAICLGLTLVTVLLYLPITRHQFISIDDDTYIYDNPQVKAGLTWSGVAWALQTGHGANWHPLTWMSHMLDCQIYGLEPGGHHLTNVLFHALNSLLLFLLLRRMTGAIWRSALVAALFAWHPLHVESVAWASERKDVLSAMCFLLTLFAYVEYVARKSEVRSAKCEGNPKPEIRNPNAKVGSAACQGKSAETEAEKAGAGNGTFNPQPAPWYILTLLLFALGLMSKPMLVTLPFVLLLLDFWPLHRFSMHQSGLGIPTGHFGFRVSDFLRISGFGFRFSVRPLLIEKLPFLALALASSIITFIVQRAGGAVWTLDVFPLKLRIANALLAYVKYIAKAFWPADLSIIYPLSRHMAIGSVILAALLLMGVSVWFTWRARRQPCLAVGWFWFLGTLVPTIGLVQVGSQAMADRYMYIPSIGLFVLIVWGLSPIAEGLHDLCRNLCRKGEDPTKVATKVATKEDAGEEPWRCAQKILGGAAVTVLAGCLVGTWGQLKCWEDNQTLFGHAVKVTKDNFIAYNGLGNALDNLGKHDEAMACYERSLEISPLDPEGQYYLGTALMRKGKLDEAMALFNRVLEKDPKFGQAHNHLGKAFLQKGKLEEAAAHFSEAIRLRPFDAEARYNLGTIWLSESKINAAAEQFSGALELKPDYWEAHSNLGIALMRQGKLADGAAHFTEALRLNPGNPEGQANLGLALLELNQPAAAAAHFAEALRLKPDEPRTYYRLAQALARQGKPGEAVTNAKKAKELAQAAGQSRLAVETDELLKELSQ